MAMFVGGFLLTQRQIGISADQPTDQSKESELTLNVKNEEFKLRSTYPGLVLIVCGTALAVVLVRKRFYFKTQHQDKQNNIPGFTELES